MLVILVVIVIGGLCIAGFLLIHFAMKQLHNRVENNQQEIKETRYMMRGIDIALQNLAGKWINFEKLGLRVETALEKINRWIGGRNNKGS